VGTQSWVGPPLSSSWNAFCLDFAFFSPHHVSSFPLRIFLPLHLVVSAPYRAAPYRGAPELFSSVSQLVLLVGALSVRAVLFVVPVLPPASASFAGVWWFGFRFGFGFG